jgi:hypothetical protein
MAFKAGYMAGTDVADTILANVHSSAKKAGHMEASDLIKSMPKTL